MSRVGALLGRPALGRCDAVDGREERPHTAEGGRKRPDPQRARRIVGDELRERVECRTAGIPPALDHGDLYAPLERTDARERIGARGDEEELRLRRGELAQLHVELPEVEVRTRLARAGIGPVPRDTLCLAQVQQRRLRGILSPAPARLYRIVPPHRLNQQRIGVADDPRRVVPEVVATRQRLHDAHGDQRFDQHVQQVFECGMVGGVDGEGPPQHGDRAVPVAAEPPARGVGRGFRRQVARVIAAVAEAVECLDVR